MANSAAACYGEYLQKACSDLDSNTLSRVASIIESTAWDAPTSALDLNNFAVVALIEAEQSQNLYLRRLYLDVALEALEKGVDLYKHPLCAAHLALVMAVTGDLDRALEIAFTTFIDTLHPAHTTAEKIPPALVYLPPITKSLKADANALIISQSLESQDGFTQSLFLLSEAIRRSQLVFYTEAGQRLLHLAIQFFSASVFLNLKLGIYSIFNKQWEGLFYLHRAEKSAPDSAPILQALYLGYKDIGNLEVANFWLEAARGLHQMNPDSLDFQWTNLGVDKPITCVPFETELLLAVQPSFRSIVTSVLIAEGDWFEKEMEFWRSCIKPGMTVIDVGANVGVYTFSAALRVGSEGRVLAIEPFSGCVHCLQATCLINQLDWVTVCAGAASDREGTARLSLRPASELNEIVSNELGEKMAPASFEEVPCFSLDSLIERENIRQVDFLKIDAEGHEIAVLAGSDRLLSDFSPIILYENQMGSSQGSNLPVAETLIARGYQLFRYQPYMQKLIPIESAENWQRKLNLIAIPANKIYDFIVE